MRSCEDYPLVCPKCGSEDIQDEKYPHTKRFYYCSNPNCNYGSFRKATFKKAEKP